MSFNDPASPYPVTIPMIGHMGSFDRPSADTGDVLDLYLHGYISSRLLKASRTNNNDDKSEPEGLPITASATHVDGLVLSLAPNSHSYNYRSAVLFGRARPVTDAAERLWAMELITNAVVPRRWQATRQPPTAGEHASTGVLRVRVAAGSAKIRSGPPADDAADLADEALRAGVWTGVLPVWSALGDALPAPDNRVEGLPAYIGDFVKDANDVARETAVEQAARAMKPKKADREDD